MVAFVRVALSILAAVTVLAPGAWSQTAHALAMQRFEIDPMHSSVAFASTILGAVRVRGRFKDFAGTVIVDDRRPERSSVSVIIQATSLTTDMDFRDDHLRSPDFFDVKKFPTIEFVSDRVTPIKGGATITGNLTMHGVTRRVALPAKMLLAPRLVGTTPTVAFSAAIRLSRADFGIAGSNTFNPDYNPLTNMLSDSVDVLLELSANRASYSDWTWGRGNPPGIADTVNRVLRANGVDAAITTYRELRANRPAMFGFGADQLDALGHQLAEQGRLADALALLRLNAELYGTTPGILEGLGETEALANDPTAALETYQRALVVSPQSTSAREMIRHLRLLQPVPHASATTTRSSAQWPDRLARLDARGNSWPQSPRT
jgi:polyisoprenoid-binding protein YceI